jgi:hypothetical protein
VGILHGITYIGQMGSKKKSKSKVKTQKAKVKSTSYTGFAF